jgi:predicted MFS family arabinose efflux permease
LPRPAAPIVEPRGARAILLLALGGFFSSAAFRICDPLLPQLAAEFHASTGAAANTITVFSIAYGALQILWGPVGDRFGKYRTAAFATAACAIGNVGALLSTSLPALIACRFLAGATGGGIIPLAIAWIGDTVPYAERQMALARFMTGTILGIASGQFVGGFFADVLGWRYAFAALAAGYLIVGLLLQIELSRSRAVVSHAAVGVASATSSVRRRATGVLASRWARIVLVTVALEGAIVFGALAFVPSALHRRFDISLTTAGAVVSAYGFGGVAYTLVARPLVGRLGERGLAVGGGIVMLLAFGGLWLAPSTLLSFFACFAIGFGFYMLHNTLQTNATQMAPSARGIAVAMFASCFFIGQSIGVAVASIVVDRGGERWLDPSAMVLMPVLAFAFARLLATRPTHHYGERERAESTRP